MKTRLLLLCLFMASYQIDAQCPGGTPDPGYTCIPDGNFEQALIDLNIDTNATKDQQVLTSSIENLTSLDVSGYFISDLTGIEAFSSLQTLNCSFNNLVSLDLFNNTALLEIDCGENSIGINGNQFILPDNNLLTSLICRGNNLSSLDVSDYPDLEVLQCYNMGTIDGTTNGPGGLGALDLSANTKLISLICHNAGITSLNISSCTNLDTLWCFNSYGSPPTSNSLSTLDISGNVALSEVRCYNGGINTIVYSASTYDNLTFLDCGDNNLGTLNPSKFPNIQTLWCYYTNLSSLTFTNNLALTSLDCGGNPSINIDFTSLPNLEYYWGYWNEYTSIDVSTNTNLILLNVNSNPDLSSIMLPDTSTLKTLWAYTNGLSDLNFLSTINKNNIEYFDVGNGNLTSIDVSTMPNLIEFYCNNNASLSYLNIQNGFNENLEWMWAHNTNLSCIQVDNVTDANNKDTNKWRKGAATYSTSCPSLSTPDQILNNLTIYPNPTRNTINMRLAAEASYSIVNIMGKVVDEGILGSGMNTVDLSHTGNGIYFLTLSSPEGRITKKIMKQ